MFLPINQRFNSKKFCRFIHPLTHFFFFFFGGGKWFCSPGIISMILSSCGEKSMEMVKIGRTIHIIHSIWYPVRMGGSSRQNDKSCIKAIAMHDAVKKAKACGRKAGLHKDGLKRKKDRKSNERSVGEIVNGNAFLPKLCNVRSVLTIRTAFSNRLASRVSCVSAYKLVSYCMNRPHGKLTKDAPIARGGCLPPNANLPLVCARVCIGSIAMLTSA
jgi:hypothetical protein